jgi:hypothetical protein
MKILIGCDVDPVLPAVLASPPSEDIWSCLKLLDRLVESLGPALPPITWLIRSDESVRFATGAFDSGFLARASFWRSLIDRGHEVGWHMHLMSFDHARRCFAFDAAPAWLPPAYAALAAHVNIVATRTGWDYGSNHLFGELQRLGVQVDFSALPGNIVWHHAGPDTVLVNWLRCPGTPYCPAAQDYQRPGRMQLLEIPIAQFHNPVSGVARRGFWRLSHGCLSLAGLRNRTLTITQPWPDLPKSPGPVWAFFFHPEEVEGEGLPSFARNLERLRGIPGVEFVTCSSLVQAPSLE